MDLNMESMLDIYLFETKELLDHLDEILMNCEKINRFDGDGVNEIFRIMHTVKGSSAMMQFESLAHVSHKAEDLFSFVRQNGLNPEHNEAMFDLMFRVCDFMKSEVAHVEHNEPLTIDIGSFEHEINDLLKKVSGNDDKNGQSEVDSPKGADAEPPKAAPGDAEPEWKGSFPFALKVFLDEEAGMENLRALMLKNEIRDAVAGEISYEPDDLENGLNSAAKIRDNGFCLFFSEEEDLNNAAGIAGRFIYAKRHAAYRKKVTDDRQTAPQNARPGESEPQAPGQARAAAKQSLISVSLTKLNSLMDLMGEIVITESMVTAMQDTHGDGLDNRFSRATRQLRKLTDEMQETVMSLRMVPISGVFQKMNRIVRDMSKKLDKDVRLVLIGEETEVDRNIADSISDPIMHVVRNSMDHGIEQREDRLKTGKPATGTVTLSAKNTGGDIVVTIMDDGRGIDRNSVLAKAKRLGLMKKPEAKYSDREVYDFLLMPGFSTNEEVTEYSGRGVGMDVVKKNVEKVGGDVTIDSELGEGTKIVFKIPITLAILNGMKVSVGESMFILPVHSIRQSFKVNRENVLANTDMQEVIKLRDRFFPLIRLSRIYNIQDGTREICDGVVILVETHELSYCILVDELICEQQVVVKPLPGYLKKYNVKKSGIEGCAILGDGSISLILDAHRLYMSH